LGRSLVGALAVVLAAGAAPRPAAAWGDDAHRITAEIAWRELTPAARAAVRRLLPRGRYSTLYEASTWADTYAKSQKALAWLTPLHFVNLAPTTRTVRPDPHCECVLAAVDRFAAELADTTRPHAVRVDALRNLAHFVGDVHQPLHVTHTDGRGGTQVDVRFAGRWTTLHFLWDYELIDERLRGEDDWRDLALALHGGVTPAQRAAWRADLRTAAWAQESLDLARTHTFHVRDGAILDRSVLSALLPVIEQRLSQAGVRLAALLEKVARP
jgi:hypothetical protein